MVVTMTTLCELVLLQTFSSADVPHTLCVSPATSLGRGDLGCVPSNPVVPTPNLRHGRLSSLRNALIYPVNSAVIANDQSENQERVRCSSALRPRRTPMERNAEGSVSALSQKAALPTLSRPWNLGQPTYLPPLHRSCVIDRSTD